MATTYTKWQPGLGPRTGNNLQQLRFAPRRLQNKKEKGQGTREEHKGRTKSALGGKSNQQLT